jgi:hypothetical protein
MALNGAALSQQYSLDCHRQPPEGFVRGTHPRKAMRYVILRDDDTNALTPPHCLERLYRPFLDRGLPVNLATIPEVDVNTRMADGHPEGYLVPATAQRRRSWPSAPIRSWLIICARIPAITSSSTAATMTTGIRPPGSRRGLQTDRARNASLLMEAGFPRPQTFVAPYDKLSRASLAEVAARFRVLSTGWFEWRRLPYLAWWPKFALKKLRKADHWRIGGTWLLSHPGCLLSCHRPRHEILDAIIRCVETRPLTVLVTHWWEYFRNGQPDDFIQALHETAEYLSNQRDVKTIAFDDLARGSFSFPFASVGRDSVEP